MNRYSEQFKLKVVRRYLSGRAGYRAVATEHGVAASLVRRWVGRFKRHGKEGLASKPGTLYSAQFKLSVVQHMWREELSYAKAAVHFDVRSPDHVKRWERQYHSGGIDALVSRPRGRAPKTMSPSSPPKPTQLPDTPETEDTRTREQLLKENEYLRAEVAYLKKLDALVRSKKLSAQKKKRK